MPHRSFPESVIPYMRHKGLKQQGLFGGSMTFDKFKWIVPERRGLSPDTAP